MRAPVTAACVQVEPAIFDRAGTIDRVAERTAEAAGAGAGLVVFPETFIPAYPSSVWAKALAGWGEPGAKEAFALLHRESLELPGPDADRLAGIAREHGVWLVIGVNEVDPARPGTLYNSLLYYSPAGELALHHRKLVPTNHERLVWGPGDGRGLRAIETPIGRLGGLICWENYMPLARFSLYESGIEIYIASTADDGDSWQATLRHIALESRSFVVAPCHFQRASSYPDDFPLASLLEGRDIIGRGGSAILGPDGSYLAGPLYDEEGILYAELDPEPAAPVTPALRPGRPLPPAGRAHADRDALVTPAATGVSCRGYRPVGLRRPRGIRCPKRSRATKWWPRTGTATAACPSRSSSALTISARIQPPARRSGSGSCSCERASRPPPARSSTPTGVETSPPLSR